MDECLQTTTNQIVSKKLLLFWAQIQLIKHYMTEIMAKNPHGQYSLIS
jgi:hypothetical protein